MKENKHDSKKLLSIIAIIALVTLAGCVGPIEDPTGIIGGDDVEGEDPIDAVPSESNVVMQFDPIGLAEDPTTSEIGNHVTNNVLEQNETYDQELESAFDEFNTELDNSFQDEDIDVNIQAQDFGQVILFGDTDQIDDSVRSGTPFASTQVPTTVQQTEPETQPNASEQYVGLIIELELSEQELAEIFDAAQAESNGTETTFTQEEYNGFTVFTVSESGEEFSLSILESGTHVMGPKRVVEDAIDTYAGDAEGVDPSIVPESGSNTYLSVGTSDVNETLTGVSDQVESIDQDPVVESSLVTYSTNGDDTIELNTELTLDSSQAPFQMQLELEDQIDKIRESGNDTQGSSLGLVEPLIGEDNIDINSEGDKLSVDYQVTTDEVTNFIDEADESGLGGPTTQPDRPPVEQPPIDRNQSSEEPNVTVEFEQSNGNVTATLVQNENADEVYLRSGVATWGDPTAQSFGQGLTSGSYEDPMNSSGDTITTAGYSDQATEFDGGDITDPFSEEPSGGDTVEAVAVVDDGIPRPVGRVQVDE